MSYPACLSDSSVCSEKLDREAMPEEKESTPSSISPKPNVPTRAAINGLFNFLNFINRSIYAYSWALFVVFSYMLFI